MTGYLEMIFNGFCLALGSGIGTFIIEKKFLKRIDRLEKKIKQYARGKT